MSEQQRLRYTEISSDGVRAMRGVEHYLNVESGLEPVLLELVRLRASLMNGCEFCIGLHGAELRKRHQPESRIGAVAGWRQSDTFSERERAALRWTEVVTSLEGHVPDEAFAEVRQHFDEKEVVDLALAIASINAWNRMAIAFRPQWNPAKGAASASAGAGGTQESQVRDAGPRAPKAGAPEAMTPNAGRESGAAGGPAQGFAGNRNRAAVDDGGENISTDEDAG